MPVSVTDAANQIGVDRSTVWKWIVSGKCRRPNPDAQGRIFLEEEDVQQMTAYWADHKKESRKFTDVGPLCDALFATG